MSSTSQGSNVGFIKNRGFFVFTIDRHGQVTSANQATVASEDQKIKVFLNGVIYNHDGRQLVEGFLSHGVDYVNQVEGSFIIFLIVGTQFYILTDKVNSKKGFYAFVDNVWHISNDIDALPRDKCQLNLDGIACYLANGFMLNDLTLFKEIKSTRRACVHSFTNGEIIISSYWAYKFSNHAYSIDQYQQFKEKLISLLIESVDRRYATVSSCGLSLSAGHDFSRHSGDLAREDKSSRSLLFFIFIGRASRQGY